MRPFYRKDLFRDEIIKIMPKELTVKIDQGDKKLCVLKMERGQSATFNSQGYEVGLVILSGTATVTAGTFIAKDKGNRKDVFSGQPTAIYIPRETEYTITATGYGLLEVALCMAKTENVGEPFIVETEEVETEKKGVLNWQREVHEIFIPEKNKNTCGIIVGETYGCPGNWAVYPYKDGKEMTEVQEEMIFFFKFFPQQGKQVQVMRSEENPKRYYVSHDTAVGISNNYLPVAQVEVAQVYTLWFKIAQ